MPGLLDPIPAVRGRFSPRKNGRLGIIAEGNEGYVMVPRPGDKRSRKQDAAIAALLECQTHKQAAEKAGIGERTLRTWLKIPEFRDAYQQARRECVDQAVSRLERNFEFPIAVLQKIAGDPSVTAYARVSAARALIEAGFKAIELGDMTERLRKIEERLMQKPGEFPRVMA